MSLSNDKALKSVAEAVNKIMEAEKKAKMDYDKDGKIESPKDEVWGSRFRAARAAGKMKEETEQLQEYESKNGVFRHKAKLEKGVQYGETDWDKEEKEAKKMTSSPKRAQKGYGARQNFVRSTRVNEKKKVNEELSFTEMLELYNEHGLKVLAPIEKEEIEIEGNTIEVIDADKINGYVETVVEEADQEEFNKDLDTNKKKAAGTAKQPDLAKGDTQAVKNEEVEQLDELSAKTMTSYVNKRRAQGANPSKAQAVNKAITKTMSKQTSTWQKEETELDERHLTSAESEKKKAQKKADEKEKILLDFKNKKYSYRKAAVNR